MNKLVSRNPILRFKEGKKILFAKPGDKMLYNGKEVVTEEILDGQTIYRRKNGTYIYPSDRNLTRLDGNPYRKVSTVPQTKVFTNTDRYTPIPWKEPSVIEYDNFNNNWYSINTNPNSGVSSVRVSWPNPLYSTQNTLALSQTKAEKEKKSFNTKLLKTNNIFIKGFQNRRGEIKDVRAIQNQLIKLGLLKDKFGADGKWGKNTEAAYQKYLQYLNNPSGISAPLIPTVERDISPWEQMNTQENIPLYQKIKFKQGGQLPSRNIVERFKNGGVLKFQKAGNLPTAPKAEKRFRKNSYNTTKEGNRETTTITSQTFGYNRNWPYFRQPATIQRIIEGGDTAFVETPEHHIFTKVLPRTALKSGNVYVEYNPKYDKNYSLYGQANTVFNYPTTSLEYETLKRRFNTAWNLSK